MNKKKFKLRISNMFHSSYASCSSKNSNKDVLEKPQNLKNCQSIKLFSLRKPFLSFCKHKKFQEFSQTQENIKFNIEFPPRSKITEQEHLLHPADNPTDSRKFPPVSPLSSFHGQRKNQPKRSRKTRKPRARSKSFNILDFQGLSYNGLFSSDEESEDEAKTTPFLTSRSLSTVSSESYKRNNPGTTRKPLTTSCRRNRGPKKDKRIQDQISSAKKVSVMNLTGSFAVVKRSRDPYNDFKASMVEMIVEKSIVSAEDLENMLHCFMSLNSNCHHRIIVQVFTEIWEALLSSSS